MEVLDVNKIGIYRIVSPRGSCYVGLTLDSFADRWRGHHKDLRRGVHKCVGLARAYHKYGWEELRPEILQLVDPTDLSSADLTSLVLKLEQEWWDRLDAQGINIYNGRPTGTGSVYHTEESRSKISQSIRSRGNGRKKYQLQCAFCHQDFIHHKVIITCSRKCALQRRAWGVIENIPSKETLTQLANTDNHLQDIGDMFGVSSITIYNLMREYGVQCHSRSFRKTRASSSTG